MRRLGERAGWAGAPPRRAGSGGVATFRPAPTAMLLGTIVGTVWATRKDPGLVGMKFLIVREIDLDGNALKNFVVAADAVGAGEGEVVLVAQGSSGRQTELTTGKAVDAVVMAIVDRLDVADGEAKVTVRADETDPLVLDAPEPEAAR